MIPSFPHFVPLSLKEKQEIEKSTSRFLPYSDFNFISLWAWDIEGKVLVSMLNGNLIVKLSDYLTSDCFYTFIGSNNVLDTVDKLFNYCKETKVIEELKLIPQDCILQSKQDLEEKYLLTEDIDNFDYVLSLKKIAIMEGKKLHQKRKKLKNFLNNYSHSLSYKKFDLDLKEEILSFFYSWAKNGQKEDIDNELKAIKKLFLNDFSLNLTVQCAYSKDCLIGYTIFEELENGYVLSNFQKADFNYEGVYEFLNNSLAKYLFQKGFKYMSIEQDLGIPGLRRAKLDYDPTFLKKYIIRRK